MPLLLCVATGGPLTFRNRRRRIPEPAALHFTEIAAAATDHRRCGICVSALPPPVGRAQRNPGSALPPIGITLTHRNLQLRSAVYTVQSNGVMDGSTTNVNCGDGEGRSPSESLHFGILGPQNYESQGNEPTYLRALAPEFHQQLDEKTLEVVEISVVVTETIYTKFMRDRWDDVLERGETGYNIFEAYTRQLMIKRTLGTL